ncbi:hypothetical protein LVJ94_17445 [Pendulispora rubella]|uniref:Uncharacterized protein n=1 Tax=Pendulispora rubella TaxID=2741070 RepID=A0ABZ2LDN2_9BACT
MNVIADICLSPHARETLLPLRPTPDQCLEQLVFSLEDAAFRLLEHENRAYIAGDFEEVVRFAKWRNEIRLAADALGMAPKGPGAIKPNRWDSLARSLGPDESGVQPIPTLEASAEPPEEFVLDRASGENLA